jgi:anti-sigma-K factor RskA
MSQRVEPIDYVLGELSRAERREAERLLREDPDFRAEVERLRPIAARLFELPAEAWTALDAAPPPAPVTGPPARLSRPRPAWRLVAVGAAACALVAAVLGVRALVDSGPDEPEAVTVALEPLRPGAGEGRARIASGKGSGSIEVEGLPRTAAGEFYEAWLLSDPQRLVSIGRFEVDASGRARLDVRVPEDPERFAFVDISLEEDDGDPSHSGNSVLRGPLGS